MSLGISDVLLRGPMTAYIADLVERDIEQHKKDRIVPPPWLEAALGDLRRAAAAAREDASLPVLVPAPAIVLDTAEVAAILGWSHEHVRRTVPSRKVKGRKVYDRDVVHAIAARRRAPMSAQRT